MLNFLRKNKENVLIKIVLGIILVSFAIYFGTTSLDRAAPNAQTAALVNGEPISAQKTSFYADQQLERMREIFKDEVPQDFVQSTRQTVLNTLINQELIAQELLRLGITASKKELVDAIKGSPQFQNNGSFDADYYQNKFLPGYQITFGSNFERDQLKNLAQDKFFSLFENIFVVTEKEAKLEDDLTKTSRQFSVIKVPKDKKTDGAAERNQALEIYQRLYSGKLVDDLLKKYNLIERRTAELSFSALNNVLDGKGSVENLKKLLAATKQKPLVEGVLEEDNALYVVKLIDLKEKKAEGNGVEAAKTSVANRFTQDLEKSFITHLRSHAEIEIQNSSK